MNTILLVSYLLFLLMFLLALVGVTLFIVSLSWYGYVVPTLFVPSRKEDITAVVALVEEFKNKKMLDIGSGMGDVLHTVASRGGFAVGIEINPALVLASRIRLWVLGVHEKSEVIHGNVYTYVPPKDIDVVYLYLMPEEIKRMQAYLVTHFPGKVCISNRFPIKEWEVSARHGRLFCYTIPTAQQT